MSMDTCNRCDAPVDTDFDLDCYQPDPAKPSWDICVCERCRERETEMTCHKQTKESKMLKLAKIATAICMTEAVFGSYIAMTTPWVFLTFFGGAIPGGMLSAYIDGR